MFRFFVEEKFDNDHFVLSQDTLKHLKVARILPHEKFVCIFENEFYLTVLEKDKAKIIEKLNENHEFNQEVILAMSIINIKRFEWLIQKATELGVRKIIPIFSQNVQISKEHFARKTTRFYEIAKSASEQSFRNKIPIIENTIDFNDVLNLPIKNKFIAHEKTLDKKINSTFNTNVLFLVGPEGGFADQEVVLAQKAGFVPINLGQRILRAETAALFLLSRIVEK